jgi:hypothetical protein
MSLGNFTARTLGALSVVGSRVIEIGYVSPNVSVFLGNNTANSWALYLNSGSRVVEISYSSCP